MLWADAYWPQDLKLVLWRVLLAHYVRMSTEHRGMAPVRWISVKGLIQTWVLGKDIEKLPKPAPKGITANEDVEVDKKNENRFGLDVPGLGRVTGYAEAYKDLLTGKSDQIGRSYGCFVFIRGRLINVVDGHFGIDPNELRHGTFGRFRLVINIGGFARQQVYPSNTQVDN